jgi:tRNA threonylcarbamoyladenosine biosynthesis protein TsaE
MDLLEELRAGIETGSAAATQAVGRALAPLLPPNAILALHGDLGVGKTTLVQGLAAGFGIAGPVTSPTFNLCRFYRGSGPGARNLGHVDAYRLSGPAQVEALLLEDFLQPPFCLAIEWPENIGPWLPADAWHFDLAIVTDHRHRLRLR